jgi:poly(hydroxyalkanoate) granule-associated protein
MTDEVEVTEEILEENGPNPMLELARKMALASIGAVALTQEELEKIVNRLIERGEIAEKDGRKLVKDVMARRKKKTEERTTESADVIDSRLGDVMGRMNIPSKSDIEALDRKITLLTEKVDKLGKAESD